MKYYNIKSIEEEEDAAEDRPSMAQLMDENSTTTSFVYNDLDSPHQSNSSNSHTLVSEDYVNGTCVYTSMDTSTHTDVGVICIHGIGQSAHVYSMMGESLRRYCVVVSFDMIGHGKNQRPADSREDLGILKLEQEAFEVFQWSTQRFGGVKKWVVVGHSIGACVAARVCRRIEAADEYKMFVRYIVCIDMMEHRAVDSIPHMVNFLKNRPESFKSIEEAVEWSIVYNVLYNRESANISIPHQMRHDEATGRYVWIFDAVKYIDIWTDWMKSYNSTLLSLHCGKSLVLRDAEGMDSDIRIGYNKSMIKIVTVPHVGHNIMEDDVSRVSNTIKYILSNI